MRVLLFSVLALAGCRQIAGLDDLDLGDGGSNTGSELAPSNEVPADHSTANEPPIIVNDLVVFDTDTGQITGAIVRVSGEGIVAGIKYSQADFAGTALGVFAMSALSVNPSGVVKLQGTRAAVFIVEKTVKVDGRIDGGGGCADVTQRRCGGPGGGGGAAAPSVGTGCAPGQPGNTQLASGADTGGGGGGGGQAGAAGGNETAMSVLYQGGAGGPRCMTIELEPLLGGAGGGGGGKGTAPQGAAGGGGGGGFQLSVFGSITVSSSGVITMPGAGGEGGTIDPASSNGGAGGGGGAGGSILLESPVVTIAGTIAANGGGGGGGSTMMIVGQPGANGTANAVTAMGGAPGGAAGIGGNGGVAGTEPTVAPATVSANAGGGGGGVGRVFLRTATTPELSGSTVSPAPGVAQIRTR